MTAEIVLPRAKVDTTGWLHKITFANEPTAVVAAPRPTATSDAPPGAPVVAPSRARSLNGTSDYARAQKSLRDSDVGPERIKALRAALALTQRQVAAAIGVGRPVVALAEHAPEGTRCGTRRTVWDGLCRLAAAQGMVVP